MRLGFLCLALATIIPAVPAQTPGASPETPRDRWRAYAEAHPEDVGLARLLEALGRVDSRVSMEAVNEIDPILREGWRGENAATLEWLTRNREIFPLAAAAASADVLVIPPSRDFGNWFEFGMLTQLLCLEARRRQSMGEIDDAAELGLQVAILSNALLTHEGDLPMHLIGLANLGGAGVVLSGVAADPAAGEQTLRRIETTLRRLDEGHVGIGEALRVQSDLIVREMTEFAANPVALAGYFDALDHEVESQRERLRTAMASTEQDWAEEIVTDHERVVSEKKEAVRAALANLPAFEAEARRLTDEIAAQLDRPPSDWDWSAVHGERSEMGRVFSVLVSPEVFKSAAIVDARIVAQMRLCRGICALRLRDRETLGTLKDPFTGQPLRMTPDMIYSLGPDQEDQGGAVTYDATNGTLSAGDIVARR